MGADFVSDNDPGNHRNRHPAPDDDVNGCPETLSENLPETVPDAGSDGQVWWYDQPRKRGTDRRYWGEVEWIRGPESDRLREKLNAIFRDLLVWAHDEQQKPETDPDADSGEDGDTDDTCA